MANRLFYWCVDLLKTWAKWLNMTYEEINVLLFCIIGPTLYLALFYIIIRQNARIRSLKRKLVLKPEFY